MFPHGLRKQEAYKRSIAFQAIRAGGVGKCGMKPMIAHPKRKAPHL